MAEKLATASQLSSKGSTLYTCTHRDGVWEVRFMTERGVKIGSEDWDEVGKAFTDKELDPNYTVRIENVA
jgi:hypothetical protein